MAVQFRGYVSFRKLTNFHQFFHLFIKIPIMDERHNCPILQELVKCIKLESKSGILSCLKRLKDDSRCCKQFVKDGGIDILVNLLRYFHNTKVLNMTLSILADACMNSDARKKVQIYLFSSLKSVDKIYLLYTYKQSIFSMEFAYS